MTGEHIVADHAALLSAPEGVRSVKWQSGGESSKTLKSVTELWEHFAELGLGRRDRVAAVGGGVIGDLTGFAAATWMRGIDWIDVPTTLLAMVDASVGGKTGCDIEAGKNLVGSFHSPRLTVIDTDFLDTLSENEILDGKAEMIKHEIIGLKEIRCAISVENEIAQSVGVKVDIVLQDPFETKGLRALLNCGHTVAHALEKASGYRISHGRAVAIGCMEEAKLAARLGMADADWPANLKSRFLSAGLKTELPQGFTFEKLIPYIRLDKKHEGDEVTFALPCGWEQVKLKKVKFPKPVKVPPSKSHAQRLMLANFLAGELMSAPEGACEDILAMERCLKALAEGDGEPVLDCGESAAVMRFLAPVAAALGKKPRFVKRGTLVNRPCIAYDSLSAGRFELRGDESSQFVSGLLFALPLLAGDSEIELTTPLVSRGYVAMTLDILKKAGIVIDVRPNGYRVRGGQRYRSQNTEIEGDWSAGAVWYAINALGGDYEITGLCECSLQPDRAIVGFLKNWPQTIDVSQFPDLYPLLRVIAAALHPDTEFLGTGRLRKKECDRVAVMDEILADGNGAGGVFRGGEYDAHGDHRIAMALAVMATRADSEIRIRGKESVAKSYPGFKKFLDTLPFNRHF